MIKIWKAIDGYYFPYRINENADIEKQEASGRWVSLTSYMLRKHSTGYGILCVTLRINKETRRHVPVKNLMANAFMGGRRDGYIISHKNGMMSDCALENLYFTTQKELATKMGNHSGRSVEKIDPNGKVLDLYSSVIEAAKSNYVSKNAVWMRCTNRVKDPFKFLGYSFRYEERKRAYSK